MYIYRLSTTAAPSTTTSTVTKSVFPVRTADLAVRDVCAKGIGRFLIDPKTSVLTDLHAQDRQSFLDRGAEDRQEGADGKNEEEQKVNTIQ